MLKSGTQHREYVQRALGLGVLGDEVCVAFDLVLRVGGAGEPGDVLSDGEVAGGVADAGEPISGEAGSLFQAGEPGGFADVCEVAVDVEPRHGDAEGPRFACEGAFEVGDEEAEGVGVGVVEGDGCRLAGLDRHAFGPEVGADPAGCLGDHLEVALGDGGVHQVLVCDGVVHPDAVLADDREGPVSDQAAHRLCEWLRATGAERDDRAVVPVLGDVVVGGDLRERGCIHRAGVFRAEAPVDVADHGVVASSGARGCARGLWVCVGGHSGWFW